MRTTIAVIAPLLMLAALAAPAWGQEAVTRFVVSEKTDAVAVYRGSVPALTPVASIKVGRELWRAR